MNIRLSNGMVAIVDDGFDYLLGYKWRAICVKGNWYAVRSIGRKNVYLHREVMGFPSSYIRHSNGNSLDNRLSNLSSERAKPVLKIKELPKYTYRKGNGKLVKLEYKDGKLRYLGTFSE